MTTPTDPLFASQWHFPLIGDIETIWDEFSGAGIHVGVYDDGVDYNHEDLDDNYDASAHVVDNFGNVVGPFPVGDDAHGTACAGLIAAESDNGAGGTGVASGATITGVNIFNSGAYGYVNAANSSGFMDVAGQAGANFDISSNSWGSTPRFGFDQNIDNPFSFAGELHAVYGDISAFGRGGLGTIITQAAGNDGLDANGSGVNSSRFTITVAASDAAGDIQDYSNFGASILVTAPAGSVTTDVSGAAGYSSGDYTSTFGGTSAATPIVSGVVALMLEASENGLGWRDVQNILAISASETGSGYGNFATGWEVGEWAFNSATNWNGGGMAVSGSYGFGMVDAYAAVRMAEVWDVLYSEAQTSANEVSISSSVWTGNELLPDGDPNGVNFTLTVSEDISIEHIELSMGFNTTYAGDLSITVTTPDGTVIQVLYPSNISTDFNDTWTFGIDHLLGETSAGTWTINVADNFGADFSTVTSLSMELYGQAISNDDVYHYTNDFLTLVSLDGSRLGLSDDNGGEDWLNLAAVGEAGTQASLDLATGLVVAEGEFGPVSIPLLLANSGIEHVVSGDSDDTITGTDASNSILGMRGDDVLYGQGGSDTLEGGAGDDLLWGGNGADRMWGGAGADTLIGEAGNDSLYGGDGNDWLEGGTWADSLYGGDGDDRLYGGDADDLLEGGAGDDSLAGGAGRDAMYGGDGADALDGGLWSDSLYGGDGNDSLFGNWGDDTLWGGIGDDILDGGGSNDTLYGESGNDLLIGGVGRDTLWGGAGNDTLNAGSWTDFLYGGTGDDYLDGGDGHDSLYGGAGNDTLIGGTNRDRLEGGDGNDSLYGGSWSDLIFGGNGDDLMYGGSGDDGLGGGDGNDVIYGGDGRDNVLGGAGNDILYGGTWGDTVVGGFGDDTLYGGAGDDILTGGSGADVFVFTTGHDRITDFDANEDRLLFDAALWNGTPPDAAQLAEYTRMVGDDMVITFNATASVTLEGFANLDDLLMRIDLL